MKHKLFLLLFLFYSISVFAGGPWTPGKKHGFLQIQTTFPATPYNQLFISDGSILELNRGVMDITIQAFLEYGINEKFSLITSLPYKFVSTNNEINLNSELPLLPEGSLSGLGNYEMALKYKFLDKTYISAVSVKAEFNTSSRDLEKGLATGYDASGYSLFWHIGRSFGARFYSFFESGYTLRTNDFSNDFRFVLEAGYQPANNFWLAIVFDKKQSMENGNYNDNNLQQTGLYTNNQEFFAFGLKTSYGLKSKIGFSASTFGAFSGNYVAHSATFNIGVFKKW
ncbi:MAG: hypothetical protein DRJ05_14915 [Bacteroidetes bacterium]|nr:MAG: hypothetical protein DRJ05_14915 [Bacteroidota bacterium]